jgi:hypothetical protein
MKQSKEVGTAGLMGKCSYEKLVEEAIRGLYKENLTVQLGPLLYAVYIEL